MKQFKGEEIRIYLASKAHQKNGWLIPIFEQEGKLVTGQNLTYEQMIGKELLTEKQREKYPYVINPTQFHKIPHNTVLDLNSPEINAKVQLAYLSGMIAATQSEYRQGVHEGYFIDKVAEADKEVSAFEMKLKAADIIRATKTEDLDTLIILVKLQPGSVNFDGAITPNQKIVALYKQSEENPNNILNCSPEHNPHIKDELFVAYAMKHKIVTKKGNGFSIMEDGREVAFMGSTILKVLGFLESNPSIKDRLYMKLKEVEPYYMRNINEIVHSSDSIEDLKSKIFIAINGNPAITNGRPDLTKAAELLDEYKDKQGLTGDYVKLYSYFLQKQSEMKLKGIKEELETKDIPKLLAKSINGYLKVHKDAMKAIEDKDELIAFMMDRYREREELELEERIQNIEKPE